MYEYRIIICGGRDFKDKTLFNSTLTNLLAEYPNCTIVSGHASGADTFAEQFAEEYDIPIKIFKPDWSKYGKAAGPIRNKEMLEYAKEATPVVIAFWDGKSKGTKNMVETARKTDALIHVIGY